MAKLTREIDNIDKINPNDFIIEIEFMEFVDGKGRSKKFKITGLAPISTDACRVLDNSIDWSPGNFHFIIDTFDHKGDK